jgi:hypothetical protein
VNLVVTRLSSATCSNNTDQRFAVDAFPSLLQNEIAIENAAAFVKVTPDNQKKDAGSFSSLAFSIDCGDYTLGQFEWTVVSNKVGLSAACRATSSIGTISQPISHDMNSPSAASGSPGAYNTVARMAANINLKCNLGSAVVSFQKLNNVIKYKCATVPGMGGCYPMTTEQAATKKLDRLDFMTETKVICNKEEVLHKALGESSGDNWF